MKSVFVKILFTFCLFLSSYLLKAQEISAPDTVKIGTYVISLHDINFRDKEYTIRFWMWMLYKNAEFDFANKVEVPNAKALEKPDVMIDSSDGRNWVLMKMKCIMKQSWSVQDFPFDRQKLVVHVENSEFDRRSLVFQADTLGKHYDPELTIDGWDIENIEIRTGTNGYETAFGDSSLEKPYSEYSTFDIIIDLDRDATGLFLKLFIGMYVSFFIGCLSFLIHPNHVDPRFGLPVGALFAIVGNKYIIDSLLPETSTFTLVDTLHAITIIFTFFIIALSSFALILNGKGKTGTARKLDKWGAIGITGVYFLFNIIMIVVAILH